jgi:tRNA pseudouridine55 synthase
MPDIHGILLVNKPQGLTSNSLLQKVKRLIGAKKAGHTGSLDPLATGMLPLCFGEATKISQYLLDADKCYQTTGLLGIKTDSSDATGKIIAESNDFTITESELREVLTEFHGSLQQVPSMYSALKHQGQPLYKLAREGITIERAARNIILNQVTLNAFDGKHFSLTISCSKGTYIRNVVEDIGERLGVGAHVTQLHRVYTAGFENYPMYSLDDLMQKTPEQLINCLLPMDMAIDYLPKLMLSNEELITIRHGKTLQRSLDDLDTTLRLYNVENTFIGIGELSHGNLKAKRLLAHHFIPSENE